MIRIKANDNGSHDNHEYHGNLLAGWAVCPFSVEEMENFPFGTPTVEDIDGVMTVTAWEVGEMPEPAPETKPEPTLDERVSDLEAALAQTDETAIELFEAQAAQEEINAAQDDALIELYEMVGG